MNNDDNRDVLDFTSEGQPQQPYQCEFCTILLLPHSDPNRLTSGQLWICPTCGTVKDDSISDEPIMGARPAGTVMDGIANPANIEDSVQFIQEEKGIIDQRQNRVKQLFKEEIYGDKDFRKKGVIKDSVNILEFRK